MYWSNNVGASKAAMSRGGLYRVFDLEQIPAGEELGDCTGILYKDTDLTLYFNNEVLTFIQLFEAGLVTVTSASSIQAEGQSIIGVEATVTSTSSGSVSSSGVTRGPLVRAFQKDIVLAVADEKLTLGGGGTFVGVVKDSNYLYYADSLGAYVYSKTTYALVASVTLAGITSIAATTSGMYLGTASGVYFLADTDITTGGDQTAQLVLKYTTATTPSVQSNSITCLAGSGVSLLIGNSVGLDYIPDDTSNTVYTATSAGVTDCAVKGLYIAYVVSGLAYSRALPSANFTVDSADTVALEPVVANNITNMDTNVQAARVTARPEVCGSGDTSMTHIMVNDSDNIELLKINPDNTFSSVQTLTVTGANDFVAQDDYCYRMTDLGYETCKLFKRVGDVVSEVDSNASTSNISPYYFEPLINAAGTKVEFAISAGGIWEPDSVNTYLQWTRSGDTLTYAGQHQQLESIEFDSGWSPDGAYAISAGSYNTQDSTKETAYLSFNSNLNYVDHTQPRHNLSSRMAWVSATQFVVCEKSSADKYYLVMYSVVSGIITYQSELFLGDYITSDGQDVYNSYVPEVLNGTIVVIHGRTYFSGVYAYPMDSKFYTVIGAEISEIGGELTFVTQNQPKSWFWFIKPYIDKWVIRVRDYDPVLETEVIRYNLFEFDNATVPAYNNANCVAIESCIFAGTDIGIIVEDPTDNTTRKITSELGANTNVVAVGPSGGAGKTTGDVAYGVDDLAGNAKAGIIDLEV